MRLPTAQNRGVQSLGRRDINAPLRVANAEARAAQYEGEGMRQWGALATEVSQYMTKRADENAVAEFNTEYLKAQAEAEKALGIVSAPKMSTSTPGLSGLDYQRTITITNPDGGTSEVERTEVPNYEVGGPWLTQRLDSVRDAALGNITSRRAKDKFSAQWALLSAKAHTSASATFRDQRTADRRGGYELNKEQYLQNGDEDSATALAYQSFAAGTIDGEQLAADIQAIHTSIDTRYYTTQMALADGDQSRLEDVMDMIDRNAIMDPDGRRPSRLSPEDRWTLRQQANTMLNQEDAARGRVHEEGAAQGAMMLLDGTLTRQAVKQLLASDKISATTAQAWEGKLRTRAKEGLTVKSTPGLVDSLTLQIQSLRRVTAGTTVEQQRSILEQRILALGSGVRPDGTAATPGRPPLTGADTEALLKELDTQWKRTYNNPAYSQAEDELRTAAKAPPRGPFESVWSDSADALDARKAFTAGQAALNKYVSTYGDVADPVAWVRSNKEMFDPNTYKTQRLSKFATTTAGAKLLPFLPELPPGDVRSHTQEEYTTAIGNALTQNSIDIEQAQLYYDKVNGLTDDGVMTPGAKEAIEAAALLDAEAARKRENESFWSGWFSPDTTNPKAATPGTPDGGM